MGIKYGRRANFRALIQHIGNRAAALESVPCP